MGRSWQQKADRATWALIIFVLVMVVIGVVGSSLKGSSNSKPSQEYLEGRAIAEQAGYGGGIEAAEAACNNGPIYGAFSDKGDYDYQEFYDGCMSWVRENDYRTE